MHFDLVNVFFTILFYGSICQKLDLVQMIRPQEINLCDFYQNYA